MINTKIEQIAKELGLVITDARYSTYRLKGQGYKSLIIRANKGKYVITAFLPDYEGEYRNLSFRNTVYKDGYFDIKTRSVNSLIGDIKRRILDGYEEAINNRRDEIIQAIKSYNEYKEEDFYLRQFLAPLGFRSHNDNQYLSRGQINIKNYISRSGNAYTFSLTLDAKALSEVVLLLDKLGL